MIRIFKRYISDESMTSQKIISKGCWLNIINPSQKEIKQLKTKFNIPVHMLKDPLDDDERPRVEINEGTVYIIIRAPIKNEDGVIEVIPLGIIVTEGNIITVSLKEVKLITDFYETRANVFTTKKTRFVVQILSRSNVYYQKHLDEIEKQINNIENKLLKSSRNEEIVKLLGIQKSLIYINTAVVSNNRVLSKILNGNYLKLFEEDEGMLNDTIIDYEQSIEMASIYSNLLTNMMDAYASIISNNLNNIMKFLASITVILAIPTIIASFYGMNVELPLQDSAGAFMLILILSIIVSFIAVGVFIKKKFF